MPDNYFPALEGATARVLSLSEAEFEILRSSIAGGDGLASTQSRLRSLSAELGGKLKPSELFTVLTSIEYVYDQLREWTKDGGTREAEFQEFVEVTGVFASLPNPSEAQRRIALLVQENQVVEKRRKLHYLRTGILETAVEFSAFVDIRPLFDQTNEKIEGFVPSVILRFGTNLQTMRPRPTSYK